MLSSSEVSYSFSMVENAKAVTWKWRSLLFHLLPFLHLCACAVATRADKINEQNLYGNIPTWLYFLDFPVSWLTALLLWTDNPPLWLTGTLWWYLVSYGIRSVVKSMRATPTPER
jgi:hypothetical protein